MEYFWHINARLLRPHRFSTKQQHMVHLSSAYFSFFRDLALHNTTEWFGANKSRYETEVKKPFLGLVSDLLTRLEKVDSRLVGQDPRKLLFRINRDIRFSKDKSPYKLNSSAVISPGGKNSGLVGLYFHVGLAGYAGEGGGVFAGGGCYAPTPEQLQRIREEVVHNGAALKNALEHPEFRKFYRSELQGEQLKRAPKGFEREAETHPLVRHKQFYYGTELTEADALSDGFLPLLADCYRAGMPLYDYFARAVPDG